MRSSIRLDGTIVKHPVKFQRHGFCGVPTAKFVMAAGDENFGLRPVYRGDDSETNLAHDPILPSKIFWEMRISITE
jgi:hypothetical protein